ncbi:hypothetical protein C2869_15495 [Saccharobesus litoralis]|uniref:Pyrimidine/purine nucleoside phosphorylase n=1 Tax=Saccharobesus litoralis TaxID=2172099 RepID=A0A2S0VU96_9ALTE|nr:pyrimidine/purine nucleoside phosphorylase [Saccharobesus litoralis]AWB67753.1 hypothetical protein C2869_15495 [Saccharobesus litoralis]
MSEFNNVTVVKAANVYFDGKVTSRTVKFESGEAKTLGIMMPGDYEFGTEKKELMEILQGEVDVQVKGAEGFTRYEGGQSFEVPANSSFKINALGVVDYCCSYID